MDKDTKRPSPLVSGWLSVRSAAIKTLVMRAGYGILLVTAIAERSSRQMSFDPWMIVTTAGSTVNPAATFENPYVTNRRHRKLPDLHPDQPGVTRTYLALDPETKLLHTQQWSSTCNTRCTTSSSRQATGSKATHLIGSTRANQALLASPEHPIHDQTTTR